MLFIIFDIRDRVLVPVGRCVRPACAVVRTRGNGPVHHPRLSSCTPTYGVVAVWNGTTWDLRAPQRSADDGRGRRRVCAAKGSIMWPATFGLACCAIEMMARRRTPLRPRALRHGVFRASPRRTDLMIVAGRVSQKMAPVLRQITTRCPTPSGCWRWVCAPPAAACSTTTRSCRASTMWSRSTCICRVAPAARMLIDAILKIHDQVQHTKLGAHRGGGRRTRGAGPAGDPHREMKGLMR